MILPGNLAPHDWHVNGKISHDLYAEIEGVADPAAPSSSGGLFSFRSRPSQSRTRSGEKTSRSRSRAGSPRTGSPITSNRSSFTNLNGLGQVSQPIIRPNGSATNLVAVAAALSLNGTGHGHGDGNGNGADGMPQTPSYEQSEADAGEKIADDSWLRGFFEVKRALMLFYNPNPSGGTTDLAERQSGFAATVGPWHLEMISDVVSRRSLSPLSSIRIPGADAGHSSLFAPFSKLNLNFHLYLHWFLSIPSESCFHRPTLLYLHVTSRPSNHQAQRGCSPSSKRGKGLLKPINILTSITRLYGEVQTQEGRTSAH